MKKFFDYVLLAIAIFGTISFHAIVVPLNLPLVVILSIAVTLGIGVGFALVNVL